MDLLQRTPKGGDVPSQYLLGWLIARAKKGRRLIYRAADWYKVLRLILSSVVMLVAMRCFPKFIVWSSIFSGHVD
jgi:hypothetical protein